MSAPIRPIEIAFLERAIDALISEHPELAEDETLRADMLEGSTSLHDLLGRILNRESEADSMVVALSERVKDMRARSERFTRQKEAMRRLAMRVLDAANMRTVQVPEGTLTISAGRRSVIVTDETALPDEAVRLKRVPDATAIKSLIESGTTVPGATLSNGSPTLTIRRR